MEMEKPPAGRRASFQGSYRQLADALPLFVSVCSPDGQPGYFSRSWRERGGADTESDRAGGLLALAHPEDAEKMGGTWRAGIASGKPFELECRLKTVSGGAYHRHLVRTTPLTGSDGEIGTWVCSCIDITARIATEERLREEARSSQTLYRIAMSLAAEHRAPNILQLVVDETTTLADAEFGMFIYRALNARGEPYECHAYSGLSRQSFDAFSVPRNSALLEPTFEGHGVVRLDDVRQDAHYGRNSPHFGMPEGHVPVVSYMAVPVISRGGEVLGGLFFGHGSPDVFTERHEHLVVGVAAQAAIALDNARLYDRLTDSIQRLGLALSVSNLGDWSWDAETDRVALSPRAAELWGLDAHAGLTWKELRGRPRAQDRERIEVEITQALDSRQRYHVEYPVALADGTERWVVERGVGNYGEDGKLRGAFGVAHDSTDRKRMETELRARAEELAQADKRKDEFLAILAHELRNPIAPIQNALQVISWPGADEQAVERARSVMERQTRQMVRLIDDLMDVSRINRGRLELAKRPVELSEVVESALEGSLPQIQARSHTLEVELPAEPAMLNADPARLAQAFSNLLNNAAKYTEPGGRIRLCAETGEREVVLFVRDTGIGIAPEMLEHVFDMFAQADTSLERRHGGLGIGLTLARQLVEMQGGSISARSEGVGCGSEFIVRLPRLHIKPSTPADVPQQRTSATAARRRVLVAEDNPDSADTLADLIRILGAEVQIARDGQSAVEMAADFRPDLVLMDIGMPKLNGYEAARRIRKESWGTRMTLVALTGWGQQQDRQRAREAGFDHHLVKPAQAADLQRMLS